MVVEIVMMELVKLFLVNKIEDESDDDELLLR